MTTTPDGYLGADTRIAAGPAPELVEAGYQAELADAPLLHRGLGLADLAHVLELHDVGVIPPSDMAELLRVLLEFVRTPADAFPYDAVYGDAYNSRERELERRLGKVAGWLHTGRTRREAGRIAFRMAVRERLVTLHEAVSGFVAALRRRAEDEAATVWADTTYLQPAQPSTFGHYLAGFAVEAARHLDRVEAAYRWFDFCPAGVGGVAGSRVPLDRDRLCRALGFAAPGPHTRDVMWAVDGLADAALAATQAATTADRLAEDLEIFTNPGFGYVELDASLCRASVLLPQKRNPYALAVIRSGANTLIGRTTGLLVNQRTPSARTDNWLRSYGELAAVVELAQQLVSLAARVVDTLRVRRAALFEAAGSHFTGAADLAEWLVLHHRLDYRTAYRLVGRAVAAAVEAGQDALQPAGLEQAAQTLGLTLDLTDQEVAAAMDPAGNALGRHALGGSAPDQVRAVAERLASRLEAGEGWRRAVRERTGRAEEELVRRATTLSSPHRWSTRAR